MIIKCGIRNVFTQFCRGISVSRMKAAKVTLNIEDFGVHKEKKVKKFTWTTKSGMSVTAISYGAIIQSIKVPDAAGKTDDMVLGFDDLDSYVKRNDAYFGATIGRCANRVGNATFDIDSNKYCLFANNGKHSLHGGKIGFDKVVWDTTVSGSKVIFSYLSKDMEEGYPGDLVSSVAFELKDDQSFHIDYTATTTKKTVVSLTNHSYFNIAGHDSGADGMFRLMVVINADRITTPDPEGLPTGGFTAVQGTPFDFNLEKQLGKAIQSGKDLFDINFCINTSGPKVLGFVARVSDPVSGRYMEVYSNQPGLQFYTGNGLPTDKAMEGKCGAGYCRHGAFCMQAQKFPDTIHHTNFPSNILTPGGVYKNHAVYKFGVYKK